MQSQIDSNLTPEPSGINAGKILIAKLRAALATAKSESTQHGTNIETVQSTLTNLINDVSELEGLLAQLINATNPYPIYLTKTEADLLYAAIGAGSGGGNSVELTRAAYNALAVKDPQTWYVIIPG